METQKKNISKGYWVLKLKIKMNGKYKYLFFTCDNRRKKELIKKLKVKIIHEYPKIK